ncbi:HupE/UreJ family protein [Zarconia navalis]|nr:HupE/UreJ family protein [Zarconia navalis]
MLGGGLGILFKVVTAFTLAHSITLSLAVLNLVSLPTPFIESAIALSVVWVAAENLWRKEVRHRWLLTFGFGLIHGLGFAGILQEMNLATTNLALTLASFNIGVEIGQLCVVTIAFFAVRWLQKYSWALHLRHWVSLGTIAIGSFWFAQRVGLVF